MYRLYSGPWVLLDCGDWWNWRTTTKHVHFCFSAFSTFSHVVFALFLRHVIGNTVTALMPDRMQKQEDREVLRSSWTSTYTVLVVRMCGLSQHAPVTSVRPTEIEHPRTSQIRSVHFRNVSSVPTCFGKSRGLSGSGVTEIIGLWKHSLKSLLL